MGEFGKDHSSKFVSPVSHVVDGLSITLQTMYG